MLKLFDIMAKNMKNRQTIKALEQLSDEQLKDIGLRRSQIPSYVNEMNRKDGEYNA